MRSLPAILFLSAMACSPDGRQAIERHTAAETATGVAADTGLATVAGRYTWGAEVNIFEPCGASVAYWVAGDRPLTDSLRRRYEAWRGSVQPAPVPYSPMFARLVGRRSTDKGDGFAADYDGTFTVDSIIELRGLRAGDCETVR